MSKPTKAANVGKPAKPYPSFPLTLHASGRFAKKINGRLCYYGRWGNKVGPRVVPVDDLNAAAAEALEAFNTFWPFDSTGRARPATNDTSELLLKDLCNHFRTSKQRKMEAGRLSPRTVSGYRRACDLVIDAFGSRRAVAHIGPPDFDALIDRLAKGRHPTSVANDVRHIRILFRYAYESNLIDRPVRFGPTFKAPSTTEIRKAEQRGREKHGKRMLQPAELRTLLTALEGKPVLVGGKKVKIPASPALRAMVLLGVNCGFGQTDVANLKTGHIDFAAGIVEFPRVKTAVERRCPLWPETIAALRSAIADRPFAKSTEDDQCVFLTRFGRRWVTVSANGGVTDTVGASFSRALLSLGLKRPRLNFYCLRHITETIGAQAKDQPALDYLMGHVNPTMGGNYVEEIGDDRLRAITECIRSWKAS